MTLQNKCDIHTHTIFSKHAYSTIWENVQEASRQGLEILGSADHFSAMICPDYRSCKNYQYLMCTKDWPREWLGVTLLHGVEADIVDRDGHLFGEDILLKTGMADEPYEEGKEPTLYHWTTRRLDYVIASIHGKDFTKGMTQAQVTRMYLNALDRPDVFMLGHLGRTGLPFDTDEVLQASKAMHKPIEINEHSFGFRDDTIFPRCRKLAERCAELGVEVAVSTDAHICCDVGRTGRALAMLEEIGFPQELIITRDGRSFLDALRRAVPSFAL